MSLGKSIKVIIEMKMDSVGNYSKVKIFAEGQKTWLKWKALIVIVIDSIFIVGNISQFLLATDILIIRKKIKFLEFYSIDWNDRRDVWGKIF